MRFGEVAVSMFIIVSGTVSILLPATFVRSQIVYQVAFLDSKCNKIGEGKDGSFFGELALVYGIPRTATVRTLTECVVLVLEKEGNDSFVSIVLFIFITPHLVRINIRIRLSHLIIPKHAWRYNMMNNNSK